MALQEQVGLEKLLFNILMGLIEINKGSVLVDGTHVKTFNNNDYKKLFGYVPQDCFLFNYTLEKILL